MLGKYLHKGKELVRRITERDEKERVTTEEERNRLRGDYFQFERAEAVLQRLVDDKNIEARRKNNPEIKWRLSAEDAALTIASVEFRQKSGENDHAVEIWNAPMSRGKTEIMYRQLIEAYSRGEKVVVFEPSEALLEKIRIKDQTGEFFAYPEKNALGEIDLSKPLPDNKILQHFAYKEGCKVVVIGGKHSAQTGEIEEIRIVQSSQPNVVRIKATEGEESFESREDSVFVVGEEKIEVPGLSIA